MTKALGRLHAVELRDVWEDEARDFTPWLGNEENLGLLGEAVGLELELETLEAEVGPFAADILCKNIADDTWVLIENQVEKTDHRHLGQILTYAAGLSAKTVIWLAKQFTEEHRAALDWLNENTAEDLSFFGLEIELWCIGDSPPAPKFNVVSKPNDWTREVKTRSASVTAPSDTKKTQYQFWTAFKAWPRQIRTFNCRSRDISIGLQAQLDEQAFMSRRSSRLGIQYRIRKIRRFASSCH